jgi:transcriptional regulator GlxA family with amidase domain
MPLINVAIVAVDGFSPFHYSVPCILFGDTVSGEKRFTVTICAEKPGFLTSKDGFALNATQDFSAIGRADIVVVPYWQHVLERPPQTLLDSLVQARDRGAEIVGLCLGRLCWAMRAFSTANARHPLGVRTPVPVAFPERTAGYQCALR